MVFFGIDIHKSYLVATALGEDGELEQRKLLNDREELSSYFRVYDGERKAVVEATSNWQWFCDFLEDEGIEAVLAHPLKTKAIASAKIKTDKIDSKMLAYLLSADLIAPAWLAPAEIRQKRDLLRYRASLVKIQTGIKNRIHSLLIRNNIQHEFTDLFGKAGMAFLARVGLPGVHRLALDGYLSLIAEIRLNIKEVDGRIKEEVAASAAARLLMTMPGVGYFFSLLIDAEIGDIDRFPSSRHLCSYGGLIPSTSSSGGKTYHGRITKQGSVWLRWAMVEAATIAAKYPGPIRDYYLRMKKRKGTQIARVATARKMLSWVYYMLAEEKTFDQVMSDIGSPGRARDEAGVNTASLIGQPRSIGNIVHCLRRHEGVLGRSP